MAQEDHAEIHCACFIARFEGLEGIPFPEDDAALGSLGGLDRRLRRIELEKGIGIAPPTSVASWDSLAWRITRVEKKLPPMPPLMKSSFSSLLHSDIDISVQTMESLALDLAACCTSCKVEQTQPLSKLLDDEQRLDVLRQRLCYIGGVRRVRPTQIPISKNEVYIFLADLSLNVESRGPMGRRPIPGQNRVGVSRCPTCSRARSVPPPPLVTRPPPRAVARAGRADRWFRFDWIKNLACWRKGKIDDDSSSTTSSTITS